MNEAPKHWWRSRHNQALAVFLAISGYFLWTEHQAHVIAALPWILILGCVGMHFFMHRGHGHGGDEHGSPSSGEGEGGQAP